jgi:cation:H+ antiporter
MLWVQAIWSAAGRALLELGTESLVRRASRLASSLGVSPLVIGLTVVAFGTSTPEMAVSVHASLAGNPDIAIGNVVGSNIGNVSLILGISALIVPLLVNAQIIRKEVPIMISASPLLLVLALDGSISHIDAGILFTLIIVDTSFLIMQARRTTPIQAVRSPEAPERFLWNRHWAVQLLLIGVGLAALVIGSRWL